MRTQKRKLKAVKADRERVMVAVIAGDNMAHASLLHMAFGLPFITADPSNRLEFHLWDESGKCPQELARNAACGKFLDARSNSDGEPLDTLVMIDNDMIFHESTLGVLDTPDYDIAAPVQMMCLPKNPEEGRETAMIFPCALDKNPELPYKSTPQYYEQGRGASFEVDAVGSGCIAIKRRVLEDPRMLIEPGWDPPALWRNLYQPNCGRLKGLDVDFCHRAKDLGYTVKVNWGCVMGHRKSVDLNEMEEYAAAQLSKGIEIGRRRALQVEEERSQSACR